MRGGRVLTRRRVVAALFIAILAGATLTAWMVRVALADPIVRRAEVALPGLSRPLRLLLVSDIHVGGPDMPPERVARIVAQANALRPDAVVIAGDFVSDKRLSTHHYPLAQVAAPLAGLRSRLGTFAVLGNHDHWRNAAAARVALTRAGVRVLDNEAARAGPLAIGGLDDDYTGHARLPRTLAAMRAAGGVPVLLSHSPDPFPQVPAAVRLMLAGHTHCGQIRLPLVGALTYMSIHGGRYACGLVREGDRTLVVSAGLGTSVLPLRLGAVPDMWLVTLRPGQSANTAARFSIPARTASR